VFEKDSFKKRLKKYHPNLMPSLLTQACHDYTEVQSPQGDPTPEKVLASSLELEKEETRQSSNQIMKKVREQESAKKKEKLMNQLHHHFPPSLYPSRQLYQRLVSYRISTF